MIHEGQGRHTALTSYAGRLWFEGVNEEVFVGSLLLMNESQCSPPLTESELLAIAQHFIRHRELALPRFDGQFR